MSSDLCSKRITQSAQRKVGGGLAAKRLRAKELGNSCGNPAGENGILDQNESCGRERSDIDSLSADGLEIGAGEKEVSQ